MEFLNKYNLTPVKILKIVGVGLLIIIVVAFGLQLIGSGVNPLLRQSLNVGGSSYSKGIAMSEMAYDGGMAGVADSMESLSLSTRNVAPTMPTYNQGSTGNTAEDYEVTEYYSTIETRNLEPTCQAISSLKAKDYVIFESANEYDKGCSYNFKVNKENKDEVLSVIESLDPKDLTENTRTIKRQIDDYTSQEEILNKKMAVIENTLNDAVNSYDEIAKVATQARDAESLAKIIDSKIRIIESLTQQKINISTQLDRLARSKADQLDRLDYVYFQVNIYENKFIDGEQISDSWKAQVKKFVQDVNEILQKSSIGLIAIILLVIEYALYILVVVLAAKFGWKVVKKIWNN